MIKFEKNQKSFKATDDVTSITFGSQKRTFNTSKRRKEVESVEYAYIQERQEKYSQRALQGRAQLGLKNMIDTLEMQNMLLHKLASQENKIKNLTSDISKSSEKQLFYKAQLDLFDVIQVLWKSFR